MTDDVTELSDLELYRRILFIGPVGCGKSTQCARWADARTATTEVWCLSPDPGNPSFGPPTTVGLARRMRGAWRPFVSEPVGTLDAIRFRMPIAQASARIASLVPDTAELVIDAPGITRGGGAMELIAALAELLAVQAIVAVGLDEDDGGALSLIVGGPEIFHLEVHPSARAGSKKVRRERRTAGFLEWVGDRTVDVKVSLTAVIDAQPKSDVVGRVGVGLTGGHVAGTGWVTAVSEGFLRLRWKPTMPGAEPERLVLRDAELHPERGLQTVPRNPEASPVEPERAKFTYRSKPVVPIRLPSARVVSGRLHAIGDLFDDPMFLLRLEHRKRCLALDIGELRRVPTRVVHELTDVFVSHAHLDHVRDFPWLLRRRLGCTQPCTVWGPPGFHERFDHMIHAFTWDRLDDRGPVFHVVECDGAGLDRWSVRVGDGVLTAIGRAAVSDGVILEDDRFRVRATLLDHGGIPVVAYAIEERARFAIRADVLRARGWAAGKWLGELKRLASMDELEGVLDVPSIGEVSVRELAEALLLEQRAERLVYATDFADTPSNRERVIELARDADVFICEAMFLGRDVDQALRTGHLTTRACREIAEAANVRELVPFHPSARYEDEWEQWYEEVLERGTE